MAAFQDRKFSPITFYFKVQTNEEFYKDDEFKKARYSVQNFIINRLSHLTETVPDLTFSTSSILNFVQNPSQFHLDVAKQGQIYTVARGGMCDPQKFDYWSEDQNSPYSTFPFSLSLSPNSHFEENSFSSLKNGSDQFTNSFSFASSIYSFLSASLGAGFGIPIFCSLTWSIQQTASILYNSCVLIPLYSDLGFLFGVLTSDYHLL